MKYLTPQEFNKLLERQEIFAGKSFAEKEEHQHTWEQIFVMNPGAGMLNSHVFKACLNCGEKTPVPKTEAMDAEIQKMIKQM